MKFKFSQDLVIDSEVEPWSVEGIRLGFFGAPGSGKSYGAAVFIEQFLEQGGTLALFQPRAEWHTLREIFPLTIVGGPYLQDIPLIHEEAKLYAEAVVKDGISMVLYTGDIEEEDKLVAFAESFVRNILRLEETVKRPVLLVLEETQEYAPRSSQGHIAPPWVYNRMIKQFKDCFTQGRKLGVNPVCISQRPQEVNYTIRQLCNLVFYGKFAAQDISYIDKECLRAYRDKGLEIRGERLLDLQKGQWISIGPGFAKQITIPPLRKTKHGADTPRLEYVAPLTSAVQATVTDLSKRLTEMLEKRKTEESELEKAKRKISELEQEKVGLEEKVKMAGNLRDLLTQGEGDGQKIKEAYEKGLSEGKSSREYELKNTNQILEAASEEIKKLNEALRAYQAFDLLLGRRLDAKLSEIEPKLIERLTLEVKRIAGEEERPERTEDRTVRANLESLIKNLYTPEPARKFLQVYRGSPPGIAYTRSILAARAGLSPKSSGVGQGIVWLKRNKLVSETVQGIKLAGE